MSKNSHESIVPGYLETETRLFCEQRLAGAILNDASAACNEMPDIKATHFHDATCRCVCGFAQQLLASGKPADPVALVASCGLSSDGANSLIGMAAPIHHVPHYAQRLKDFIECNSLRAAIEVPVKSGDAAGLRLVLDSHIQSVGAASVQSVTAAAWLAAPDELPKPVVGGLFDKADRVAIVGQSKAKKSWLSLQLGVALATGGSFLGMQTTPQKTLLINGEIQAFHYKRRLRQMSNTLGVDPAALSNLLIENVSDDLSEWTFEKILWLAKSSVSDVVIIDPFYLLVDDEVDQQKVREAVRAMKRFTASGVTLVSVFHGTKGWLGDKQIIDRISGSGIFARDAATIISLCEHATEPDHVVMKTEVRNHPPVAPMAIKFCDGAFHLTDKVLAVEKTSRTKAPRQYNYEAVAAFVDKPMRYCEAVNAIKKGQGVGDNKSKELLKESIQKGLIVKLDQGRTNLYMFKAV